MASYKPITQTCHECGDTVVLFPRSIKGGKMIAQYFDGSPFVFDTQSETCYYNGKPDKRVLCSKCATKEYTPQDPIIKSWDTPEEDKAWEYLGKAAESGKS